MSNSGHRSNAAYAALVNKSDVTYHQSKKNRKCLILWRGANVVMSVFFILAAVVQVNDPDPYLWVPTYIVPAIFSLAVTYNPEVTSSALWRYLVVTHLTLCLAGCVFLAVLVAELLIKDVTNPLVHEEGRELGGLIIIVIWLAISRFTSIGAPQNGKDSISALLLISVILTFMPLAFWGLCFVDQLTHRFGHCHDMFNGGLLSKWGPVDSSSV